jgi:hypothetical protein
MEEAMLSSKLDAVALEYNQLLTSQLESQRQYFEGLIAAARMDADRSRLDADRCGIAACFNRLAATLSPVSQQRSCGVHGCGGARL